ncbi:MAG: tetratricopeptide repeat protein [Calditrichaeota bacterium]|nr:tetratricopeptide repeat protein [Calditrichota bacterium]
MRLVNKYFLHCLPLIILTIFLSCASFEYYSAEIYAEDNDWDKAVEYLKKSIIKNPADIKSYLLLGQVYGMKENYEMMNLALEKARSLIPDTTNNNNWREIQYIRDDFWTFCFDNGVSFFENQEFAEAGFSFYQCLTIDPERPEAYVNLGLVEEKLNLPDSAIFHYQQAFAKDTSNLDLMFYAANLCLELEKFGKSLELADQILSVHPQMTQALVQKAIAFDMGGEIDSAIACYQKAIATESENPDLYYNLGRLLFIKGDYLPAIENFKKVIKKSPHDGETFSLIGECYFSLGEDMIIEQQKSLSDSTIPPPEEAIKFLKKSIHYFEKALASGIDDPDVKNMLAMAYSQIKSENKPTPKQN